VTSVHVVVPEGIDDPARPSGGNTYDRRLCDGLAALGWSVHEHGVPGAWPSADAAAHADLARVLAEIPDATPVLLDGLIASNVPEVLVPEAARLRLVLLVHMPLGERSQECQVLSAASGVVTTSEWTRGWLLDRYALRPAHVYVAQPGVDAADLAPGTAAGGELLCVAAVTPGKGHDVLIAALATVIDQPWRCVCVGSVTREPGFVDSLSRQAQQAGIGDRVRFIGPRTGAELGAAYSSADALLLASRAETYGMVVTEALAHGLPVIATAVGGLPEALGHGSDGVTPGLLVPPDDSEGLAGALRCWLGDPELRQRLRRAAEQRRAVLHGWKDTAGRVSRILAEVAA
jgi:glycosyltransferase involved in cell wall biosynthesis